MELYHVLGDLLLPSYVELWRKPYELKEDSSCFSLSFAFASKCEMHKHRIIVLVLYLPMQLTNYLTSIEADYRLEFVDIFLNCISQADVRERDKKREKKDKNTLSIMLVLEDFFTFTALI